MQMKSLWILNWIFIPFSLLELNFVILNQKQGSTASFGIRNIYWSHYGICSRDPLYSSIGTDLTVDIQIAKKTGSVLFVHWHQQQGWVYEFNLRWTVEEAEIHFGCSRVQRDAPSSDSGRTGSCRQSSWPHGPPGHYLGTPPPSDSLGAETSEGSQGGKWRKEIKKRKFEQEV